MSANTNTQKIIHITYHDFDGLSAGILSSLCGIHFSIILRDPDYINSDSVVEDAKQYDKIIITDIAFSENVLNQLLTAGKTVCIYDHHRTSQYINKYPNCISDSSRCSTKIYFEEVIQKYPKAKITGAMREFVELVDVYERWQQDSECWSKACDLNRLYMYYNDVSKLVGTWFGRIEWKIEEHDAFTYDDSCKNDIEKVISLTNKALEYTEANMKIHEIDGELRAAISHHKGFCREIGRTLIKKYNLKYIILIDDEDAFHPASIVSVPDFDYTTIKWSYENEFVDTDKITLSSSYRRFL